MYIQILILVLQAILILIFLYFKSYFKKKGENIATSEDIEILTLKVESVKQSFLEKNAIIKSELDILTNIQTAYKNEQRLALLDFHKKFCLWIELHTNTYIPLKNENEEQEIKEVLYLYDETYHDVLLSESVMEIYIEDSELLSIIGDLKVSIIQSLGLNKIEYLQAISLFYKKEQFLLERNLPKEQSLQEYETLISKKLEFHSKHNQNIQRWNEDNYSLKNAYTSYIRKYIKELI